jgi:pSer/pThr/pTyr-binding forkhead associated (FHA) protein
VIEGVEVGRVVELKSELLSVGRRPDNDLVLPSGAVSKAHARIERHGDQFFVTDLGSTNGTTVNRQPLKAKISFALFHGDTVGLGDHTLLYRQPLVLTDEFTGLSTISLDLDQVRKEVDDLLQEMDP